MIEIPADHDRDTESFADRVILVTGATGAFGKAISLALARQGATVILLAKNLRLVEALYDEIEQAGYPTPAIYPMDLAGAGERDYAELAANVDSQLGRLDGLLHTAATLGAPTVFAQSDSETWFRTHQVNLHAAYFLTRACLPLLGQSQASSVVFMTDDKSGAYWDAYQVSKKGVEAMALLLANEYRDSGLRVNCYNPGKTRTPLQLRAYPAAGENDELPSPDIHMPALLYLMGQRCDRTGEIFTPPAARQD